MTVAAIETNTGLPETVERELQRLRKATGELVGSVFYGTLLKAMRASGIKGKYGHGGRGEEVFAAQLDAIMAEQLGTATQGGLAETLYNSLERQQRNIGRLRASGQRVNR